MWKPLNMVLTRTATDAPNRVRKQQLRAGQAFELRMRRRTSTRPDRDDRGVTEIALQGAHGRFRPVMVIDNERGDVEFIPDLTTIEAWTQEQKDLYPEYEELY